VTDLCFFFGGGSVDFLELIIKQDHRMKACKPIKF
jgi:hypothetical protein